MVNQKVAARLQVGPNCLLFFIDETGDSGLAMGLIAGAAMLRDDEIVAEF